MKILLMGTGGVGESIAAILKEQDSQGAWLSDMYLGDYNLERAQTVAEKLGDSRFQAVRIDAKDQGTMTALIKEKRIDMVMDAATPNFMKNIFGASYGAPFVEQIGEYNFNKADQWEEKGLTALLGMGIDPGVSDVFAKFAADYLFDEIHYLDVKDGNNLEVDGVDVVFGFSIETSFQELSGPNFTWEKIRVAT